MRKDLLGSFVHSFIPQAFIDDLVYAGDGSAN